MKRQFFTILVLALGMWAGTAMAQSESQLKRTKFFTYVHTDEIACKGYNAKGQLPPAWVKNKVTPEQYDSLALLNMLATVDYSWLKGYDVTAGDVRQMMSAVRRAIHRFMADDKGTEVRIFSYSDGGETHVAPVQQTAAKSMVAVRYVLYSSVDGYDAHVVLTANLRRDAKNRCYTADSYELTGYSLGGATVAAQIELHSADTGEKVGQIVIGADDVSPRYSLMGRITYTDPLGRKHQECIGKTLILSFDDK